MEYKILKLMRQQQRHLRKQQQQRPTHHFLTVKFYLATVLIITLHSRGDVLGSTLGTKCQHDMDCTDFIKGSSCSTQGYCECAPYYVQYNTTSCLSSQLLGGDCTLNEQCTMKVANSSCLDGACRCVEGFLQFRKHTCLGPAPPGSVCYSHAHCQMFNARTHCDFLIPNLFGRCQCTAPAKLKAGLCVDNTIEDQTSEPQITASSSTTTTQAPIEETVAPEINIPQQQISVEQVTETSMKQDPEENFDVSIEEQKLEDDMDVMQPTSKTPLEIQGDTATEYEPLTSAHTEKHEVLENTIVPEDLNVSDDYPYKVEEDHTVAQEEHYIEQDPMQEEEQNGEYGEVVDNTMNFDYEAAQQEMEDSSEPNNNSAEHETEQEQKHEHQISQEHFKEQEQDIQIKYEKQPTTVAEPEQIDTIQSEHENEFEYEHELQKEHEQDQEVKLEQEHNKNPDSEPQHQNNEQIVDNKESPKPEDNQEQQQEYVESTERNPEQVYEEASNSELEKDLVSEDMQVNETEQDKKEKLENEPKPVHVDVSESDEQEGHVENNRNELEDTYKHVEETEQEYEHVSSQEAEQVHKPEQTHEAYGPADTHNHADKLEYEQVESQEIEQAHEPEEKYEVYETEDTHKLVEQPVKEYDHVENQEADQANGPKEEHEFHEQLNTHKYEEEPEYELIENLEAVKVHEPKEEQEVQEPADANKHVENPVREEEQQVKEPEKEHEIYEPIDIHKHVVEPEYEHIENLEAEKLEEEHKVYEPVDTNKLVKEPELEYEQTTEQVIEPEKEQEVYESEETHKHFKEPEDEYGHMDNQETQQIFKPEEEHEDYEPEKTHKHVEESEYQPIETEEKEQIYEPEKEQIYNAVQKQQPEQEQKDHELEKYEENNKNQETEKKDESESEHNQTLEIQQQSNEVKDQSETEKQNSVEQYEVVHIDDHKQNVAEEDNITQPNYINPENYEIINIPIKQQQQDSLELDDSLNLQSIINEIHHEHTDKVVAESESVQNENEAATTQQQPGAVMLVNDEVITTQSSVLEEDTNEAETEIDFNNSQEEQEHHQFASALDVNDEKIIVDNEEEKLINKQIENNNASEIADSNDKQQNEILQETTEQIYDNTNHIESLEEFEDLKNHHKDEKNEILNEQRIENDEISQNVNEQVKQQSAESADNKHNEIPLEDHLEEEQPTIIINNDELKDQIAKEQIVLEEILPNEAEHMDIKGEEHRITQQEVTDQPQILLEKTEEENSLQPEIVAIQEDNENAQQELIESYNESSTEDNKHIDNEIKEEENLKDDELKENKNEAEISHEHEKHENTILNDNFEGIEAPDASQHQDTVEEVEQKLEESTTQFAQHEQNGISAEYEKEKFEISEDANKISTQNIEGEESVKQEEMELFTLDKLDDQHKVKDEEIVSITEEGEQLKEENEEAEFDHNPEKADHEQIRQVTELIETNYVPSDYNQEIEETTSVDNLAVAESEPYEILTEDQNQNTASTQDSIENNEVLQEEQTDSEENIFGNLPANNYFAQDQMLDSVEGGKEQFKESESISDILNNLMKEEMTLQPQYSEESHLHTHLQNMHESDVADLLAEDTNISEESVMSHQIHSQDSTVVPIDPEDKLITFYPDMQDLQPVQQLPITSQQQEPVENVEEASGDNEKSNLQENEIVTTEEEAEASGQNENLHVRAEDNYTLSPLDLPFDTSVDYEPQQFETDNLVVESTTTLPNNLKTEEISEYTETTTSAAAIEELTTQTMINLASRVTPMEPAAPITTTIKPPMSLYPINMVTPKPYIDTAIMENVLATKATTEIRKRVELSLEAVTLGLSCSNNKQCQLADPHTYCNARGVCDCAANAYSNQTQNDGSADRCGAEKTGCAPGTFQCRSSGVCISWFFVCDGRSDCNDASDEECTFNARLNQSCPSQAFQCGDSGRCISRAALCDRRKQCPHGEDEVGCNELRSEDTCPPNTFRCKSGECLPEYEYCNAIISCRDGSDEPIHLCGSRSMPNFFLQLLTAGGLMNKNTDSNAYCPHRCNNGRCRSTAIVCSGRDGCGDGTDEQTCLVCRCPAVIYDRPAINVSEFLARHRTMPLW